MSCFKIHLNYINMGLRWIYICVFNYVMQFTTYLLEPILISFFMVRKKEKTFRLGNTGLTRRKCQKRKYELIIQLTQHFAEFCIVQVWVLNRQSFALVFGPDHERVHGPPDPRLRSLVHGSPVRDMHVRDISVSRRTLEGLRPRGVRADESSHL